MVKRIPHAVPPPRTTDRRVSRLTLAAGLATAAVVLTVGALFLCFVVTPTLPQLAQLWKSGRTAVATATTTDPGNHESCTFKYPVRGHVYNNSGVCPVTGVGDTFTITYDPANPLIVEAMGESPKSAFLTNVAILLLAAAAFGFVIAASLRRLSRWAQGA